eukprot:405992-Rhodomonas_salina.1
MVPAFLAALDGRFNSARKEWSLGSNLEKVCSKQRCRPGLQSSSCRLSRRELLPASVPSNSCIGLTSDDVVQMLRLEMRDTAREASGGGCRRRALADSAP